MSVNIACNYIIIYRRDPTRKAKNQSWFYGSTQEMTSREWWRALEKLQRRVKR